MKLGMTVKEKYRTYFSITSILKATSKSIDVIVLGRVKDLAHARLFADFSVSNTNEKFFRMRKN